MGADVATVVKTVVIHTVELFTDVVVSDDTDYGLPGVHPHRVDVTAVDGVVTEYRFVGPRVLPDGRDARDRGAAVITDALGLSEPWAGLIGAIDTAIDRAVRRR